MGFMFNAKMLEVAGYFLAVRDGCKHRPFPSQCSEFVTSIWKTLECILLELEFMDGSLQCRYL